MLEAKDQGHWRKFSNQIDFELRGSEPLGRIYTPATVYFYDKIKISKKSFEWIIIYC